MTELKVADGAAVKFPPPLVPILALGAGLAIGWMVGPLPNLFHGLSRFVVGGALVAFGVGCMLSAIGLFRKTGQDPAPWKSSPELIAAGIYRWTRNPMYLSMGFLQGGLGLLFASLWIVALVPVTWLIIYFIAIRHGEALPRSKVRGGVSRLQTLGAPVARTSSPS